MTHIFYKVWYIEFSNYISDHFHARNTIPIYSIFNSIKNQSVSLLKTKTHDQNASNVAFMIG